MIDTKSQNEVVLDARAPTLPALKVVPMVSDIETGVGHETQVIKLSRENLEQGAIRSVISGAIKDLLHASNDNIFIGDGQLAGLRIWGNMREKIVSATLWVPCESLTSEVFGDAVAKKVEEKVAAWLQRDSQWLAGYRHDEAHHAILSIKDQSVYVGVAAPGHGGYYENLWPAEARTEVAIQTKS